jgi:tripartite-type tricarboxylate transporter receptor subunit TctC
MGTATEVSCTSHSKPEPGAGNALRLLACAAGLAAISLQAMAQEFPTRPISVIVAQAPGGESDSATRMWAEYISRRVGQPVIVDNRPGAGGIPATQAVLKAPADGYTLYSAGTSSMVLYRLAYKSLPYDSVQDFRGISLLAKFSYMLLGSPSAGIRSLEDLKRIASENPTKLNYGISVIGDGGHLMTEMILSQLGVKLTPIPYKGIVPALSALIAGDVQTQIMSLALGLPQVQAGKANALVVLRDKRLDELPNVPTTGERGVKGMEDLFWAVIVAKAGTPDPVARRLHEISQQFLKDPDTVARFAKLKFDPMPGPLDGYEKILATDIKKWSDVAKGLNLPQQ